MTEQYVHFREEDADRERDRNIETEREPVKRLGKTDRQSERDRVQASHFMSAISTPRPIA